MYKLVSHPRFGTTWLAQYIRKYNLDHGLQDPFKFAPSLEFLNERFHEVCKMNDYEVPDLSWDEKVALLEMKREIGIECCYKVHAYNIKDKVWFNEFYKDWTVIKLDRKDLLRAFLSYQVMSSINWDPFACHNEERILAQIQPFTINPKKIDWWFGDYIQQEEINGIKIYYEDLTDDMLIGMFGQKWERHTNKIHMDYEPYVENLDQIKAEFRNKYNNTYRSLLRSRQDLPEE